MLPPAGDWARFKDCLAHSVPPELLPVQAVSPAVRLAPRNMQLVFLLALADAVAAQSSPPAAPPAAPQAVVTASYDLATSTLSVSVNGRSAECSGCCLGKLRT